MRFALFRQVPKRQRRKKRKLNTGGVRKKSDDVEGSDEDEETDSEDEEEAAAERMNVPPASRDSPQRQAGEDPIWGNDTQTQDVTMVEDESQVSAAPTMQDGKPTPER